MNKKHKVLIIYMVCYVNGRKEKMKIALIDVGISKKAIESNMDVRHFFWDCGELVEKYKEPEEKHGTYCFQEIMKSVESIMPQFLDFNISDNSGELLVSSIIIAIEKAIEERVDIINISLGITVYSQDLYDACEKAVQHNILVLSAASHRNTISFPADFNNVICVKVEQEQSEKIRIIGDTTIAVSMNDYIMSEEGAEFDFSSTSLGCARACGYLCEALGDGVIKDKYKVLLKKYDIHIHDSESFYGDNNNILEANEIESILSNNRVGAVVFPESAIQNINKNMLHENIVAYYDYEKNAFYTFFDGKETENFDVILLLNSLQYNLKLSSMIEQKYKNYTIIYIGNFYNKDNNSYLWDYNKYSTSKMSVLKRPVIAVVGLCSDVNKIDVQISVLKSLEQDGLAIKAVTNNPMGLLYDMDVFNYPKELRFPDIVYSINRYMYLTEVNVNLDAWLINIGGGIGAINIMNTYNFGKLVDAYFSAANIDVVVMCVNTYVDITNLRLQLANLYKYGIGNIFIVMSHKDIDLSTLNYKDGLQTYYVDEEKYHEAFEFLKENVEEKVFTLEDVKNGYLYTSILDTLS